MHSLFGTARDRTWDLSILPHYTPSVFDGRVGTGRHGGRKKIGQENTIHTTPAFDDLPFHISLPIYVSKNESVSCVVPEMVTLNTKIGEINYSRRSSFAVTLRSYHHKFTML